VKIDFVWSKREKAFAGRNGLAWFLGLPQIAVCEEVQCFG